MIEINKKEDILNLLSDFFNAENENALWITVEKYNKVYKLFSPLQLGSALTKLTTRIVKINFTTLEMKVYIPGTYLNVEDFWDIFYISDLYTYKYKNSKNLKLFFGNKNLKIANEKHLLNLFNSFNEGVFYIQLSKERVVDKINYKLG